MCESEETWGGRKKENHNEGKICGGSKKTGGHRRIKVRTRARGKVTKGIEEKGGGQKKKCRGISTVQRGGKDAMGRERGMGLY